VKKARFLGAAGLAALLALGLGFARAKATDVPTVHDEPHMEMTLQATEQQGDRARADAILDAARKVMAQYPTVAAAESAGFAKFLPNVPLPIEHYTSRKWALEAWLGHFDPLHPTSLIFQRTGTTQTLVGVMYTAANSVDRDGLDARVPLSYGTWHRHVDYCKAPAGAKLADRFPPTARFGFAGSIQTRDACDAAGGTFLPVVFGWMVHVWPNEKTRDKIWAVDMHGSMAHEHMEDAGGGPRFAGLPIAPDRLPSAAVGAGDVTHGATVFAQDCAVCHGAQGRNGSDAPALAGAGLNAGQVAYMVRHPQGVDRNSAMPVISLSERDLADVAAYVAALDK
jgi:mono/diheme cytochrome c family protein